MEEPPRFDVENVEGSPRTPKISISSRFSRTSHQCSNAPFEDHLPSNSKLLLAVGTKLKHIISQLAHDVAEKHVAIEGNLVVQPSDDHFWLSRPRIVLFLIHFILFQNAFEIAFFFWIWVQFGFDSCIMGQVRYIIPRLVIGVFIQVLCSYSTLPLYAIVTQMGSSFKKAIFDEHVQVGLVGWAQSARKKGLRAAANGFQAGTKDGSQTGSKDGSTVRIQMGRMGQQQPPREEGDAGKIEPEIQLK